MVERRRERRECFGARSQAYNLTVRVMYVTLNLSDTAAVTVWVREVNKPAAWVGLYSASSGAAITAINISEATAPGTPIGRVAFSDPNTAFPWNARTYGIASTYYGAGLFTINATSGVVSVGAAPLSFWDSPTFRLAVTCTDADLYSPLTTTVDVAVVLVQVNTVTITSIGVPAGTPSSAGVNASGGSAAFSTIGGTVVEIVGAGFGPTARYIASNSPAAVLVSATYGPPTQPTAYVATACTVYTPNTVVRCTTAPGVGTGLVWSIVIAGAWAASSVAASISTSYTSLRPSRA